MLSRGQPCLRRRGLSGVLDNAAVGPDEPLLFLYPRWVTSRRSIATVNRIIAARAASASARCLRGSSNILPSRQNHPPRGSSWNCSQLRWMSSSATLRNDRLKQPTGLSDKEYDSDAKVSRTIGEDTDTTIGRRRVRAPIDQATAKANSGRSFNVFADIESDRSPLLQWEEKGKKVLAIGKTHTRPLVAARERRKRLTNRDQRKLLYRSYLKELGEETGKTQKWGLMDSTQKMLERIQDNTPALTLKGPKNKVMLIPEETVALLSGINDMAMKENIWYVPVHNGCRVHILSPSQSVGRYRKAIISGSPRVVDLVSDRIVRAHRLQDSGDPLVDIRKPVVPVFPSIEAMRQKNVQVPLIRGVWDFYESKNTPMPIEAVLDTERPTTVREFLEHIEDLLASKTSGPYRRQENQTRRQTPHNLRILRTLSQLFLNDENQRILSTAALNSTLSFFCQHEYMNACRQVLLRCEHLATVDTFNILLRACARRQDFRIFRHLLISMSRLQIRPDANTWVALLECHVSPNAKTGLFMYMMRKGHLSQNGPMRTALQTAVQDTLIQHLEDGHSVDSYIALFQNTHAANWFSPSLINKMFNATVELKNFPALNRLLEICDEHGISINSSTMLRILPICRANIYAALLYVFRYITRQGFRMDKQVQIWEKLFLIAYKGRCYNICRVIWRYACMNGAVTDKMKMSVLSSMTTNVSKKKVNLVDILWRSNAGKIIVGVDLHLSGYPSAGDILKLTPTEFHSNPVQSLMTGFQQGKERERQLMLATALVRRDIELGRRYRPTQPLSTMLDAAALFDLEWKGVPRPPEWMVQHAIQVPVEWKGYLRSS